MKTFAVIIPTFNEEINIGLLLDDIAKQSLKPNQLIVADANSKDRTREIAEEKGAVVVPGGMPGPGRNAGARVATADFLIFLDADVRLFDTHFFENAVQEFEERQLSCATADLIAMSDLWLDHLGHWVYNKLVRRWARSKPHAAGSFMMATRAAHEQINGFNEKITLAEDQDYVERAGAVREFGVLNSVQVPVSVRRLNRDGRFRTAFVYILSGLHIRTLGPITHNHFKYDFGYDAEGKKPVKK